VILDLKAEIARRGRERDFRRSSIIETTFKGAPDSNVSPEESHLPEDCLDELILIRLYLPA